MSTGEWQFAGIIALDGKEGEKSCRRVVERINQFQPGLETICLAGELYPITTAKLNKTLTKRLAKLFSKRLLTVYGHGSYHHFTYGLCKYADNISKEYSYIHIDHHCDSYRMLNDKGNGILGCGNFIPYILELTNAKDVLYIGAKKPEFIVEDPTYREINKNGLSMLENISGEIDLHTLRANLHALKCDDVYVTMDLDVMDKNQIITGYSRGGMTKKGLLDTLKVIRKEKNIIGADILGYSEVDKDIQTSSVDYNYIFSIMPEMELLSNAFNRITREGNERIKVAMQEISFKLYEDIIGALI